MDRQAGRAESTKIFKQLDIQSGRYEVPVTIPAVRVADSEVAVTFVTIQKEHDAWVKAFFLEGKGTSYQASGPRTMPRYPRSRWGSSGGDAVRLSLEPDYASLVRRSNLTDRWTSQNSVIFS